MSQKSVDSERYARFESLYRSNSPAVLGYALRRTRRPEDAADVLADVMLTAWRRLELIPKGDDARFWLLGVARNALANQNRSAGRRVKLGERLREQVGSAFGNDIAESQGTRALVHDALNELPAGDREILLLTAWEGLEPSQAAAVLEIEPEAARTRLHRARARLRRELEPHLDEATTTRLQTEEGR